MIERFLTAFKEADDRHIVDYWDDDLIFLEGAFTHAQIRDILEATLRQEES